MRRSNAPGRIRHSQFPSEVPGRFILASEPRPSRSCMGTMATEATEVNTHRIICQWISRGSDSPRYASAIARSVSACSRVRSRPPGSKNQPTAVSLSCVPVYAAERRHAAQRAAARQARA